MTPYHFKKADQGDQPAIDQLLNTAIMPGWISLSYQSAAGHHAPLWADVDHNSIIGYHGETPTGMASCSVFPCHFQGKRQRLAWFNQLRIATRFQSKPVILRDGMAAIHTHLRQNDPGWYLVSIVADNARARRLVQAGLPGFPRFEPLFRYHSLAFGSRRYQHPKNVRHATAHDMTNLRNFLNQQSQHRPLSPYITDFGSFQNLTPQDFLIAEDNGTITGTVAVWQQSPEKRMIVHGYTAQLARFRPVVNLFSRIINLPRLPPEGHELSNAFLSFLTTCTSQIAKDLVRAALNIAHQRGVAMATLGLAQDDKLLAPLCKAFGHRDYESVIYAVTLSPDHPMPLKDDFRNSKIEIGLL
ncbi:hypothetical protein [Parasulfitobacter algicola]|uniref:N-acetyltransferase domain-containing protein n=1 Tax=Parasulfitobacter algicola TaxID=2614809 RepID=A0ABX2IUQ9_9RHOB|nr:hypothetical protein [Sulfitobacter algicola]NSX53783.1 hypothetical protein [Sulfitobacter algicola]